MRHNGLFRCDGFGAPEFTAGIRFILFRNVSKPLKPTQCANCGTPLHPDWAYCPGCGQQAGEVVTSFFVLVKDFFGDFLTFDSRFFRTLRPFFFQPGRLTREYLDGHRVRYVGPIRLLLFGCILLIFLLGQVIKNREFNFMGNDSSSSSSGMLDSLQQVEGDSLNGLDLTAVDSVLESTEDQIAALLPDSVKPRIRTSVRKPGDPGNRSIVTFNFDDTEDSNGVANEGRNYSRIFSRIPALSDSLSPEEIADELVPHSSYWRRKVILQSAKAYQSGGKEILNFMIGNGTLMVLLSALFSSLLLGLLYIRRKVYWVEHFIFATHLHAVIVYLLVILVILILAGAGYQRWMYALLLPYLFFAMHRVYRQSKWKTGFKFFFFISVYLMVIFPIMVLTSLGVSFLFF